MDPIAPFKLERYFAKYEFNSHYLLSPSDCESLQMQDLLAMADSECSSLWNNLSLGYTESQGHPLLREEIAGMYPGLTGDDMIEFIPEEAIYVAMHTLLQPGDEVISIFPAYQSLFEIARSLGSQVIPWKLTLRENKWVLDLEWLEQAISPKTRLLVINFPHNPTGYLPTLLELQEIIRIADRHGLYLFCDEMYRCLEYSPADRLPPIAALYPKGISLSGLSKAFALPGLRVGWLASGDQTLMQKWTTVKDYTTICASAPSEILAIIALRSREKLASRCIGFIRKNLQVAEEFFMAFPNHFTWIPPVAGSICFPRLALGIPVDEFCQRLTETKSIMIAPGSLFDFPDNHFRLGLGRANFSEALNVLQAALLETS